MICTKCGNEFSQRVIINGVQHRLKNRTKCLICMPYLPPIKLTKEERMAKSRAKQKKAYCNSVTKLGKDPSAVRRETRKKAFISMFGWCSLCNYNRYIPNIVFHHIYGANKSYKISSDRIFQKSFTDAIIELSKCIIVCRNCHGEIHEGMINQSRIEELYDLMKDKVTTLAIQSWSDLIARV